MVMDGGVVSREAFEADEKTKRRRKKEKWSKINIEIRLLFFWRRLITVKS